MTRCLMPQPDEPLMAASPAAPGHQKPGDGHEQLERQRQVQENRPEVKPLGGGFLSENGLS